MWRLIEMLIEGLVDPKLVQIYPALAVLAALAAGFFLAFGGRLRIERKRRNQRIKQDFLATEGLGHNEGLTLSKGVTGWILGFLVAQSRVVRMQPEKRFFRRGFWTFGMKRYEQIMKKSGLGSSVEPAGFCHARALLTLMGTGVGGLLCVAISNELMVIGAVGGLVVGWSSAFWALRQESNARKNELENHLSEMLEVVALGLRSGLSFDRSFELYHVHFPTQLARESALAQQQWSIGLRTREESLRGLVATYDSVVFSRVIENVIRSLRFGSSLADSFDASAFEARMLRKSRREEEVAKAPVKMLIPTAALILPAMLLLVLGPVLLDMMQGF